jgi:TRAP transporter 4TM/12TM fusion protein
VFKKKEVTTEFREPAVPIEGDPMKKTFHDKAYAIYMKAAAVIAIVFSCYHLYTSTFGFPGALRHRSVFLLFAFVVGFLSMPLFKGKKIKLLSVDLILAGLSVVVFGYLWFQYTQLPYRVGEPNMTDMIFGCTAIALVLIFATRKIGVAMLVLPALLLLYTFYGHYIQGYMGHNEISLRRVVSNLYMNTTGIFAEPVGAAANYVMIFIIFGNFLQETGCGDYFIKLSYSLVGKARSGAALTAVVASGLFGMISGSPPANVATTGVFTIPLMKRQGYQTDFAGAVEAVASTGGQIMPPVMGAAAFIIAETLEISYLKLITYALLPALLYYITVAISVHLEACKRGIQGSKDKPSILATLKEGWFLLLPILVLIFWLIVLHKSVYRSAMWGIGTAIVVSFFSRDKANRFTVRKLIKVLKGSGFGILTVAAATSAAGIVIGCISITGLGLKFAIFMAHLSGGSLLLCLILTWLVAVILGMGLPTSAAYITTAALLATTLTNLGINPITAHLFCLYAAIISNLTPPVCVASYTAAGLSGGNAWKTALEGFWLGLPGPFLLPFMFALRPGLLLLEGGASGSIVLDIVCCVAAGLMLSVGTRGYLFTRVSLPIRIAAFLTGVMFISNAPYTGWIGIGLTVVVFAVNFIRNQHSKKRPKPAAA